VKTGNVLSASEIAEALGYTASENWVVEGRSNAENPYLHRRASEAGVAGTYVFRTSPEDHTLLPRRSLVHVAQANDVEAARRLHHKLWNLGDAPFLIVVLPHQVRVYDAFRYVAEEDSPLIKTKEGLPLEQVVDALLEFHAGQLDSGRIWESLGQKLSLSSRVDQCLLKDLSALGEELVLERELLPETAHSLIGKYIYIRYLRDREILSDKWLASHDIKLEAVLGRGATLAGLRRLVDALEVRFNGRVFPLPLTGVEAPSDRDVAFVASIFNGDSVGGQLALDFTIYNFFYIPIELLSSIYEQFLHVQRQGHKVGAYYTPEPLAEYLLSEVNSALPLERGLRILDPCCGSGVFLVLAYRRLVELELAKLPDGKTLRPAEVRDILLESIYGIERNPEACYVTEFSLILTMLSYIDPPELHRNPNFRFPELHNTHIFHADFFDDSKSFFQSKIRFDWIVGNPPWVELDPTDPEEVLPILWMKANQTVHPVARFRVCEAFTWRAPKLLTQHGFVGFIVHAKSLSNELSFDYRREFFSAHHVVRITNFSNMAKPLFGGRAEAPATTLIYRVVQAADSGGDSIVHFAPFAMNQIPVRALSPKVSWVITVYENEISFLDPDDAASGSAEPWKLALWGTYQDRSYLKRLKRMFPQTLEELSDARGWHFGLGVQLRDEHDERSGDVAPYPDLIGKWVLDSDALNKTGKRFEVPREALRLNRHGFLRKRGGTRGLGLIQAPHMVITPSYAAYSDVDFIVEHPRVGISGRQEDAEYLRALSLFLNSNIARYLAFFISTRWGVDRVTGGYVDIAPIRVPTLDTKQIRELARLHVLYSKADGLSSEPDLFTEASDVAQDELTGLVADVLGVPRQMTYVVDEFIAVRLQADFGKTDTSATRPPGRAGLLAYANVLKEELESYAKVPHRISMWDMADFIVCEIDVDDRADRATEPSIQVAEAGKHAHLWSALRTGQSQWVYVQRGLRVFVANKMYIYKPKRLIDWTRTQALLDASDVIAEVLERLGGGIENS
jgi:hypothetical protein